MTVKTPREFFERALASRFDPSKAAGLEAVIQMRITGPNGGEWTIIVKDKRMQVEEGVHPSPEIAISITDTDFVNLVNGKQTAVDAFMSGRIQFKGSLALGLRLMDTGLI
jgi:putative sterol carrier protein